MCGKFGSSRVFAAASRDASYDPPANIVIADDAALKLAASNAPC